MDREPPEMPLSGGTLTAVARVGDTVRRTAGPSTAGVHDLLRHLRDRGFHLAPEPLGYDDRGREILRYIPGDTVGWQLPWPEWLRSDDLLDSVGAVTAAYHRAVSGFAPAGLPPGQIVCHHDLAPYNFVFQDGRIAGVIDWDLSGPGTALSELAFVAWQWVPLHGPFVTSLLGWDEDTDRSGRLRRLLDAYGFEERAGFLDAVVDRIRYNRRMMLDRAAAGDAAYQALVEQGHISGMDEALGFLDSEGPIIQAGIWDS